MSKKAARARRKAVTGVEAEASAPSAETAVEPAKTESAPPEAESERAEAAMAAVEATPVSATAATLPADTARPADEAGEAGETDDLAESINSLADSVGLVIGRMRTLDRRQNLNSFVAYILFTLLLGGGFALLYQSRVGGLVRAREVAIRERDAARGRAEELQNEIGRRDSAAEAAYEYYSLLRDKRRTEVVASYPKVEQLELTPSEREFFARGVARARAEMVDAGYLAGLDAFRRGDYAQAIDELERALAYEVEGQQAALMRYYLGVSQHRAGNSDKAIRNLELALAGQVDEAGISDARYHLAAAFEELESLEEARKEYSKFAASAPRSPLAPVARRKVALLARQIALSGARAAGAGNVTAPATPAPKPAPADEAESVPAPAAQPKPAPKSPVKPAVEPAATPE